MSDDLVKRLHNFPMLEGSKLCKEAADRIEQLEAELVRTFNNMMQDAKRIEKLEAALRGIIVHCEVPASPNAEALKMFARKALEGRDD